MLIEADWGIAARQCVRIKAFKLICEEKILVAKLLRANGGCLGVK